MSRRWPYNFRPEFWPAVESGAKRQTMRRQRADGLVPQPGDRAMLYQSLRTTNAKLLNEGTITRVRGVRLNIPEREVIVDGRKLDLAEAVEFAKADGFPSRDRMFEFFENTYGVLFEGHCIEWEPVHVEAAA
ncbi:hypothetical protein [Methylibium petroleiphilum]